MSLTAAQCKTYRSEEVSDTSTNGGAQSWNESVSGVEENVWPNLEESEQTSGGIWYRKVFWRADSPNDDPAYDVRAWLKGPTDADDILYFWPTTHASIQGDITGSERLYGAGNLKTDVSSGITIVVTVEDASNLIFYDGDKIYLSDSTKTRVYEITGTPSIAGSDVTITLTTSIVESWAAADTIVASVYEAGTVGPSLDNVVKTTTSGTLTESSIVVHSQGVEEEDLELTFSSSIAFDVTMGGVSIGSGTTGSDFTGVNPANSENVLTIPSSAWGGTWAIGETVDGDLHSPTVPRWEKRIVPASVTPLASNSRTIRHSFQTA